MALNTRKFTLGNIGSTRTGAVTMRGGLVAGVRVYGVQEAIAKLRLVDQTVRRDLGLMVFRNAHFVKNTSQELAPINKTSSPTRGALKRGHFVEKKAPYTYTVVVDTAREAGRSYAGYQEFGYHDRGGNWHEGRGFMRTATATGQAKLKADLSMLARKLELL